MSGIQFVHSAVQREAMWELSRDGVGGVSEVDGFLQNPSQRSSVSDQV